MPNEKENPMGWSFFIPLILQYGVPLAEQLWQKWASKADPTQADWDALKAMAAQSAKDRMLAALIRNGIDPDSARGKELLALTA